MLDKLHRKIRIPMLVFAGVAIAAHFLPALVKPRKTVLDSSVVIEVKNDKSD